MLKIILPVVIFLFIGNMIGLDYLLVKKNAEINETQTRNVELAGKIKFIENQLAAIKGPVSDSPSVSGPGCPEACVQLIAEGRNVTKAEAKETPIPTVAPHEYYIPLGVGSLGGDKLNQWLDVDGAQAVVDTGLYPPITTAYFEVTMHLPTGVGEARARLLDTSTPYIYDGEQVRTQSSTGELISNRFPIQQGKKSYKVQMYTTVAAAVLDFARIRLVTR